MFQLSRMTTDIFKSEPKTPKANQTKHPWLIQRVQNGLKAVNGEPTRNRFIANKKLPVKYYEYDRLYGRKAFSINGIMKVKDLFDELKSITPRTQYFIFGDKDYYNREDGILVKDSKTKQEAFLSNESITNESVAVLFQLEDKPAERNERDTNRAEILIESTEHESDSGQG